jgi:hypothetical protein
MSNEFISVRKVVDAKEATDDKPATKSKVEIEAIPLNDIVSFRHWYKTGCDNDVEGSFTQIVLVSRSAKGGTYVMKIQESEEAFTERIKDFRPVIALV